MLRLLPRHFGVILALTFAFLIFDPVSAGEAFITHPTSPRVTLSKGDLADILMGRRTTWPDGTRIILFVLDDEASPIGGEVLRQYVKKSQAQYLAFWRRQVFTGKGSMPKVASSVEELLKLVAETPGALGYVDSEKVGDTVATVTVQ